LIFVRASEPIKTLLYLLFRLLKIQTLKLLRALLMDYLLQKFRQILMKVVKTLHTSTKISKMVNDKNFLYI